MKGEKKRKKKKIFGDPYKRKVLRGGFPGKKWVVLRERGKTWVQTTESERNVMWARPGKHEDIRRSLNRITVFLSGGFKSGGRASEKQVVTKLCGKKDETPGGLQRKR